MTKSGCHRCTGVAQNTVCNVCSEGTSARVRVPSQLDPAAIRSAPAKGAGPRIQGYWLRAWEGNGSSNRQGVNPAVIPRCLGCCQRRSRSTGLPVD
ncbi:hypothetical protein U0070_005861 [Myodes glareolus]|uniref:Uncharacterized protein n=1 Tax=Myodes glareolus TaxID=447135 RepID=A0AAW0IK83_MYOGA